MIARTVLGPTKVPRSRLGRRLAVLVVFGMACYSLFGGLAFVAAFTAGDNGHPTSGPYSDLKGGSGTFTFQSNGQLTCNGDDGALGFSFHLNYSGASLPAGAKIVVYLSPNQGAINGNAGGDVAGYIAQVESNFVVLDVGGLTGSGSLNVSLPVTHSFTLASGGVLGVIATESDGTSVSTSKTNSLNCTEAAATPSPSPSPTGTEIAATPSPSPSPSPTGTEIAATPSPPRRRALRARRRRPRRPFRPAAARSPRTARRRRRFRVRRPTIDPHRVVAGPLMLLLVLLGAGAAGLVVLSPSSIPHPQVRHRSAPRPTRARHRAASTRTDDEGARRAPPRSRRVKPGSG